MGTGAKGTTYQLSIEPKSSAVNMYTIFGDADDDMVIPAGYQEAAPFGANTGGVSTAFVAVIPTAAFDSWLTVGITDGDAGGKLGSVGIDFGGWTDSAGATVCFLRRCCRCFFLRLLPFFLRR